MLPWSKVVEIRVHGVGGTPPADMLDDPHPVQVAGDDTAQVLRRTSPLPTGRFGERIVEAFQWGRMTAGSPAKVLWLLLIPFSLVNLARFMLPMAPAGGTAAPDGGETGRVARAAADAVLRLIGLVLTLLLVCTVAFVAVDLVGWQCGGSAACVGANGWIPFADDGGTPYAIRLLVAAAAPSALIGLLWWFGRQVFLYPAERAAPQGTKAATSHALRWENAVGSLDAHWFWHTSPMQPVLRALHTIAATALLAGLVLLSAAEGAEDWTAGEIAVVGACGLLVAAAVVWVAGGWTPRTLAADPTGRDPIRLPPALAVGRGVAAVLLVAAVAAAVAEADAVRPPEPGANLPGFELVFNALYVVLLVLAVALLAATGWLRVRTRTSTPRRYRPYWWGLACPVTVGFGALVASGFTAGTVLQVGRLLGTPVPPSPHPPDVPPPEPPITVPDVHRASALAWGLLAGLVVVLAVGALAWALGRYLLRWFLNSRLRGGTREDPLFATIREQYPEDSAALDKDKRTLRKIAFAWRVAALKFAAPYAALTLGVVGLLALAAQGVIGAAVIADGWRLDDLLARPGSGTVLVDAGTWVITGMVAGLVLLGSRAFRSSAFRRGIGVIWDLLAFWPRVAHPIVPPPYGGRAVIALAGRASEMAGRPGVEHVVLSGYSQGSAVVVATALYLRRYEPEERAAKLALLSTGSQLLWAYPRLFPAYLGHGVLAELFGGLRARWYSLHRWTDQLGSLVLAAPEAGPLTPANQPTERRPWITIDDQKATAARGDAARQVVGHEVRLRDPMWITPPAPDTPAAPLLTHNLYYADPAYLATLIAAIEAGVDR